MHPLALAVSNGHSESLDEDMGDQAEGWLIQLKQLGNQNQMLWI
jgi:hypothetical protein